MLCEPIEPISARPATRKLVCVACGCTDDAACPGGCYWVSHSPPLCSACASSAADMLDAGTLEPGVYLNGDGGSFGQQRCPDSPTLALHAMIWVDDASGYCARCRQGFIA